MSLAADAGRQVAVAVVQAAPVYLDLAASVEKAIGLLRDAAAQGARLVAFPEAWLPGYPVWGFRAAGWDDPGAKRLHARLLEESVTPGCEAVRALADAAADTGAWLVMGANERDALYSRGTVYNSLLFFSPDDGLVAIHRKLVPTHAERLVWGCGDGSGLAVVDTGSARLGGLICWEHWMPLVRFAMHAQGEEVHVAAWPEGSDATALASRSYAFEGRCHVLAACPFMTVADLPGDPLLREAAEAAFPDAGEVLNRGGSGVVGPDGAWLAGPIWDREATVMTTVDLTRGDEERMALDAAGHYHRPDVFRLTVDTRPRPPVEWLGTPAAGAPPSPDWGGAHDCFGTHDQRGGLDDV